MKNELNEIDIKNCAYFYFGNIVNGADIINISLLLLDKNLDENVSLYDTSYKTSMGLKPLHIRINKIDGFIIILDSKIKHLILLECGLFTCDKIKYLKSGITNSINHNFEKIELIHIILYLLKNIDFS